MSTVLSMELSLTVSPLSLVFSSFSFVSNPTSSGTFFVECRKLRSSTSFVFETSASSILDLVISDVSATPLKI